MEVNIEELPPPTLVSKQADLERLLDVMDAEEEIAVDTEADSFYSYRDKVCLIQVTAGGEDWLVDPLADLDLTGFGEIMDDPDIIKVFHDAEYDVIILGREYDFRFRGLFDTRVAAAVLGSDSPGLASVLGSHFGVRLDKSQQRSNWSQRPLTKKQIAYARLDTRFLVPLMHEQQDELEDRDRQMIVDTECRRLELLEPPSTAPHPNDYARIKGARALDPRGISALRELHAMREKLAEKFDLPPFRILGNKTILEVARLRPSGDKELLRIEGVTTKVLGRIGDRIRRALDRAERNGPVTRLPSPPRKDDSHRLDELGVELHDRLKRMRKDAAEEHGIESAYMLNRHVLLRLAEERPRTEDDLDDVDVLEPWQRDIFGRKILRVVDAFERDAKAGKIPARRRSRRR